MKSPLITVLMPVLNVSEYITEAIESILNQSFEDFELLILEGGSSDNTLQKINEFNDSRITIYENPNLGIVETMNFGIHKSNCEIIAKMDGDDIAHPDRLKIQYDFLKNNRDIDLVGSNYYHINEKGKILFLKVMPEKHEDIEFMMPIMPSIHHPTFLIRKSALLNVGGYSNNYCCDDTYLELILLQNRVKMYNIQKPLLKYRVVRKDKEYYKNNDKDYYICSNIYLDNQLKNGFSKKDDYIFRKALNEYYRGKINSARKLLFKCLITKKYRMKSLRYLPFTFFGNYLFDKIRETGITGSINYLLNRFIKYDTYKINGKSN